MTEYLCQYRLPHMSEDERPLYFKCLADDEEHAFEQLMDAEPNASDFFCEIYSR